MFKFPVSEVLKEERDEGRALYDQENKAIADRIAFGRRSEGPPALYYPGGDCQESTQLRKCNALCTLSTYQERDGEPTQIQ